MLWSGSFAAEARTIRDCDPAILRGNAARGQNISLSCERFKMRLEGGSQLESESHYACDSPVCNLDPSFVVEWLPSAARALPSSAAATHLACAW